jgi:hypothetical protein
MAVLNLTMTIDDAEVPRLVAAARAVFENDTLTLEQITEMLRQYGISQMTQMIGNYERRVAIAAAESATYGIEVS